VAKQPDRMEISIRLGCGGLFGLLIGVLIALRLSWVLFGSAAAFVPLLVAIVVLFAVLAAVYGEGFWEWWISKRDSWLDS
jgi:hypothetical protein